MRKKLFTPGPTHVRDEIREVMASPIMHHRSREYSDLQRSTIAKLQKVLYTSSFCLLSTSSSTGLMEAALRNCSEKRVLSTICGAFSRRWHEIAVANGKAADPLEVPMGQAITPEMIDTRLRTGQYDALTLVHNETSTGVTNPLCEIAEVMKNYPDVCFLVDAVSSLGGIKIEVDRLGIDVILAGVQKCLALPPGLAVASVSHKAMDRSARVKNKGYYFDFQRFREYYARGEAPTTPAIPQIIALSSQLDFILAEGLENRFRRHQEMAAFVQCWVREHFAIYSDERYLSNTVTNARNTRAVSVAYLNEELGKRGAIIANGFGPLKEHCFRIGHMGDLTLDDLKWLTVQIEEILGF